MGNNWALVRNGIVINTIKWDGEFTDESGNTIDFGDGVEPVEIQADVIVGTGWNYDGKSFLDPNAATQSDLYEQELQQINDTYIADTNEIALAYSRASLFDALNGTNKKDVTLAQFKTRNEQYASDLDALDIKYGG